MLKPEGSSSGQGLESAIEHLKKINSLTTPLYHFQNVLSIVDFGCGNGRMGKLMRKIFPTSSIMAIDSWAPNVELANSGKIYNSSICLDIRNAYKSYRSDLSIFADCLEHVEKDMAFRIINERTGLLFVRFPVLQWNHGTSKQGNKDEAHLWHFSHSDVKLIKRKILYGWSECSELISAKRLIPLKIHVTSKLDNSFPKQYERAYVCNLILE